MINTREIAAEYRLSHWARIMQERTQNGASIKDYCKQIEICQNTYFYWQRKVRAAACEQLPTLAQHGLIQAGFVEIVPRELSEELPSVESGPQLRINFSGLQITSDSAYPVEKLATLLRELTRP